MRIKIKVFILTLLLLFGSTVHSDLKFDSSQTIHSGYKYLDNWDYEEAQKIASTLEQLISSKALGKDAQFNAVVFMANYYFYLGDYKKSLSWLEHLKEISNESLLKRVSDFYARIQYLSELWANSREQKSVHFRLRYAQAKDEVLVEPALRTLEFAYKALVSDFEFEPKGGLILVEIYPDAESFSKGTGLTMEQLKSSGTVAVCKFRRLMLTSPRVLLRGYNYLTTLSHELVHFMVYMKGGQTIPIWLHEGIAKYEEERWRNQVGGNLDLSGQSLLVSAIKNQGLISFEEMQPSFANFKTPKQGQLAFAEVSSIVGYMKKSCGQDSWLKLIELIQSGKNDKLALEKVCGRSFNRFWVDWQAEVLNGGARQIPGIEVTSMEFKEAGKTVSEEDEVTEEDIKNDQAWRYVRLGDLLRTQNYVRGAVKEYKKAESRLSYNIRILNKLALSLIQSGEPGKAIDYLNRAIEVSPGNMSAYFNLGLAYKELGKSDKAIENFEKALEINPFNPLIYNQLISLYERMGNLEKVKIYKKNLEIIRG